MSTNFTSSPEPKPFNLLSKVLKAPEPGDDMSAYSAWQSNPNPQTSGKLLRKLQPTIDKAISAHVGNSDPIIRSRAKAMTLQAVKGWNPTQGTQLKTHVINYLQGLKRVARKQTQIIRVPERVSLEQAKLLEATNALEDELGRNPTDIELGDYIGMSPKRMQYIRTFKPVLSEGSLRSKSDEGPEPFAPGVQQSPSNTWAELVYSDLDPVDQKILEMSIGLHGNKVFQNQQIAAKLRISPGAVSQRKAKIQQKLDEGQNSQFQL